MTYYQFIHEVEMKVKERMEDGVSVFIHSTVKNNAAMRYGLTIARKGTNIFPTIYLEEYYRQFKGGSSVESIASDILRTYSTVHFQKPFSGEFIQDYQNIKGKIIYHLVNRKSNEDLLKEVPYEEYLDLALVYYVLLEVSAYGMASMMIQNDHLKMWNVPGEEIARRARANTKRLLPYEFRTMYALLEELMDIEGTGREDVMYVLSNQIRSHGAAAILFEGRLAGIGEYLKENYYVLPSSVHEVIIVPESASPGRRVLDRLVREVNDTQVDQEDVLSDHAYYYDRRKGCLLL